jgi:type II secretion system protein C
MMRDRKKIIVFGVATLSGIILAVILLMVINASLLRIPVKTAPPQSAVNQAVGSTSSTFSAPDFEAITKRNLFRAKLQVEIPKVKSEKELEEEALTAIVRTMALKGVMTGKQKKDYYAVIDRGGQKGVWSYEAGEAVEKGLVVSDIRKDSVKLEKGEFSVVLKLFSSTPERAPVSQVASLPKTSPTVGKSVDAGKEIRKEGAVTLISRNLAEKVKGDSNMIMSSVAVKAAGDGFQVVAVDKGSLAHLMGISPNDTLQEVNGYRLSSSSDDMKKVYEALKNANKFEVKVLRGGKQETLRYEIR